MQAVEGGTIKRERLEASVKRILALKKRFSSTLSTAESIGTHPHKELAYSVASKAQMALAQSHNNHSDLFSTTLSKQLSTVLELYHEPNESL